MTAPDDLADQWARAPDDPPVAARDEDLDPLLLGVDVDDLEVDCAERI